MWSECWPSPRGCARYLEAPGCPGTLVVKTPPSVSRAHPAEPRPTAAAGTAARGKVAVGRRRRLGRSRRAVCGRRSCVPLAKCWRVGSSRSRTAAAIGQLDGGRRRGRRFSAVPTQARWGRADTRSSHAADTNKFDRDSRNTNCRPRGAREDTSRCRPSFATRGAYSPRGRGQATFRLEDFAAARLEGTTKQSAPVCSRWFR